MSDSTGLPGVRGESLYPGSHPQQPHHVQTEQAAAAYERLRKFDSNWEAREELRASGVASSTVEALYPEDYIPELLRQFNAGGFNSGAKHGAWGSLRMTIKAMRLSMTEVDQERLARDHSAAPAMSARLQLANYYDRKLGQRFGQLPQGPDAAIVLWHAYWFMSNRDSLTPKSKNRADQLMVWVGKNMLPREES